MQIGKVPKRTYFTRVFGCGQFLIQLTKFSANDIMWSSYDFMQCNKSPDTISVSIHNIHFNFTFKHYNKIIAKKKKKIIILKLKLFFNEQALQQKEETMRNAKKHGTRDITLGILSRN